jgi:riboflavin kinase/FMN adenylyltransferase
LLKSFGINEVIVRRFDRDLASIPASNFVLLLKRAIPLLRTIYVGENFCFGRGREGNVADLIKLGQDVGVSVVSVPSLRYNGVRVSSTRIRKQLEAADVVTANSCLGYTYFVEGLVVDGDKRGRTIGFPTLNIPWEAELMLKYGVYAVTLKDQEAEKLFLGVANFGVRPTVDDQGAPLLEVHVFGKTSLGPGARVQVQFYSFIREERKFASLDALKAQIAKDVALAKEILTHNPPISCII